MLYEFENPLTVQDLSVEVEKLTHVPVMNQRLFHKSHEISKNGVMPLFQYDIENNSVVKLIGDPDPKMKYNNFFSTRPNQIPQPQPVQNTTEYQANMNPKNFAPQSKYTQQNPNTNFRMY